MEKWKTVSVHFQQVMVRLVLNVQVKMNLWASACENEYKDNKDYYFQVLICILIHTEFCPYG